MFQGIEFYVVPANNHASYPHSLPMLATHPDAGEPFVQPVVSAEGLARWVKKRQALSSREEAYLTLVDGPVRRAWVWLPCILGNVMLTACLAAISHVLDVQL